MFFFSVSNCFRKKKVQPNTVVDVPIPPPVQICSLPCYREPETAPTPVEFWNRMHKSAELGARPYSEQWAWKLLQADSSDSLIAFAAEVSGEVLLERLRDAARMIQLAGNHLLQSKIKAPALIPTGSADAVVPPQMLADLLELTPFKKHIEFPGPANAPYFEAPDSCTELIAKLLNAA